MNEFLRKFDTIRFVAPWSIFRIFLRIFYFLNSNLNFEFGPVWYRTGLIVTGLTGPVPTGLVNPGGDYWRLTIAVLDWIWIDATTDSVVGLLLSCVEDSNVARVITSHSHRIPELPDWSQCVSLSGILYSLRMCGLRPRGFRGNHPHPVRLA